MGGGGVWVKEFGTHPLTTKQQTRPLIHNHDIMLEKEKGKKKEKEGGEKKSQAKKQKKHLTIKVLRSLGRGPTRRRGTKRGKDKRKRRKGAPKKKEKRKGHLSGYLALQP